MDKLNNQMNSVKNEESIYRLTIPEVYGALKTNERGLTQEEAEARLKQYGKNTLREIKGKPLIVKFLANFTHLMALLLWAGGIIGFIAQMPQLGVAVWMVNLINGLFSFWQEFRAEKATDALRQLLPSYVRVLRSGQEQQILAEDLVPGDVILLAEGDKISADSRLIEDNDLKADQSTLTGESHPVFKIKDASLEDGLTYTEHSNLIFAGTNVAAGSGKAVVFATAMETEFGKIANLTQTMEEALSPLQKEMERVTKMVSVMAVSVGIFFFLAAVFFAGVDIAESFIFSMGMIVAFVPEGLLPTVTLSLAMGVQRMSKRHALMKRLSAVETLGCTTVICTDKTGTLTQNEMTVTDVWTLDQQLKVTGVGYAPDGQLLNSDKAVSATSDANLKELLIAASLCNNARLLPPNEDNARWTVLGDPTEAALSVAAQKAGIDIDVEAQRIPRLRELPFESNRKRMSTIHKNSERDSDALRIAYVKGAPKEVLDICTRMRINGKEAPMDKEVYEKIMQANDNYARSGLRVLAIATRRLTKEVSLPASLSAYTSQMIEEDLTFLGLMVMMDPPRPEVAQAVEKCHHAGIRIIMITGDYGLTAESIAKRIGLVKGEHPRIITGIELEKLKDEELKEALKDEVVFARVAPEQKLQVVTTLQELGHVVAVTGDGVNDSPALKKADIGVAMGITGTDVAKEAADMILTDDNFASIVGAVEEGRAVYNNIRKFAVYILNSNMAEAIPFIIFLFSKGAIPLPLTVMQVLFIDLGTDMLPAIALGAEPPEDGIMDQKPRSQDDPLLNRKSLVRAFFWYGLQLSFAAMVSYFFLNWLHGWPGGPLASSGTVYQMATTMALAAIVACQVGVVFNCRTERASIFKVGLFTNKLVLMGIAYELVLLCGLIYLPFLHGLFNSAPIGLTEWAFLAIWPPLLVFIDELRKAHVRKKYKREFSKSK